jgi:hypothetical protein
MSAVAAQQLVGRGRWEMTAGVYLALAMAVLAEHLLFNLWVGRCEKIGLAICSGAL